MRPNTQRRREERIERITESGCWIWLGATNAKGYGIAGNGLLHREFYERYVGPIPDGMYVLHNCDVRCCVNPAHLMAGTQKENVRQMWERGRDNHKGQPPGEAHSLAKLTARQVDEIRVRYAAGGVTHQRLADEYGVGRRQIGRIVNRERWCDPERRAA